MKFYEILEFFYTSALVIAFFGLFVVGVLIDYSLSRILIFGGVIGGVWSLVPSNWRRTILKTILSFVAFCTVLLIVLVVLLLTACGSGPGIRIEPSPIARYDVLIEPKDDDLNTFLITETIIVEPSEYSYAITEIDDALIGQYTFPVREVSSTQIGFMIQEIKIHPLDSIGGTFGISLITEQGPRYLSGRICGQMCPENSVQLINFPLGTYFDAKYGKLVERDQYIDTEWIELTFNNISREITIAYIPKPYVGFKNVLLFLTEHTDISRWIVAVFGFICTFIIVPIFRPAINDLLKEFLKAKWSSKNQEEGRHKPSNKPQINDLKVDAATHAIAMEQDKETLSAWLAIELTNPRTRVVNALRKRLSELSSSGETEGDSLT